MRLFYLLQTLILLLLFSCGEDSVTNVKKDKEEEKEVHISTLVPPFTIHEVIPEYTFWNHQFKITLQYDKNSDSVNTNFYFTGRKLNPIEKAKSSEFVTYTFLTPGNAVSDSLEIRYYEEDDSISVYSRIFEVVNSEVKVDSVNLANLNFVKIYLKDYKYSEFLTIVFKDSITKGFESRYNYINASPDYTGMFGELIDESYLLFSNSYIQSFALRIEAKEQVNPSKQLHSYDYFYKSKKDIIDKNIIDSNLTIKLVDSYYGDDNYIYLKFRNLYDIEYINKLIFENNESNKWYFKFKPYIKENKEDNIVEELAELKFPKPKKVRFGVVNLFYSDGKDTTFKIDFGIKNIYHSVKIDVIGINFEFDKFTMKGDFQFILDTLSTQYIIKREEKMLNLNFYNDYLYNSDPDSKFIYDSNNVPIIYYSNKDSLTLNDLDGDKIDFEYKINHRKSVKGIDGFINSLLEYKGDCIRNENDKEIIITIKNSFYNNLKVSSKLLYSEYQTTTYIPSIEGTSNPNFKFDNNSYIKLTFEK